MPAFTMNFSTSSSKFDPDFFGHMLKELNTEDYETIQAICSITSKIPSIYLWILFAVGFPGNVFTIVTTLTMQVMSPATFFVALLAAFDGSALLAKLIYQQLLSHNIKLNTFGCKVDFIPLYLATVANWMLVLICAERFVSVCYPLKKISLITKRRSYIVAAVVSVFILIVYGSITIPLRIPFYNGCNVKPEHADIWQTYWLKINATFFLFLPFLLIFIFTAGIIRGLQVSRRERRSILEKGSGREGGAASASRNNERLVAESERIERTITIMMILAATLFIALSLPSCVYLLMGGGKVVPCTGSLSIARMDIFKNVQYVLVDATHAINFFIYFFTAKRFRDQLFKILTCKVCKKHKFQNKNQFTYSTQLSSASKVHNTVVPKTPTK